MHLSQCNALPSDCLFCQVSKLFLGLARGECAARKTRAIEGQDGSVTEEYQDGICPFDFKRMIAGKHQEFCSFRQQDALEYLQWLLDRLQDLEQANHLPVTQKLFEFTAVNEMTCVHCHGVKISKQPGSELLLPV